MANLNALVDIATYSFVILTHLFPKEQIGIKLCLSAQTKNYKSIVSHF